MDPKGDEKPHGPLAGIRTAREAAPLLSREKLNPQHVTISQKKCTAHEWRFVKEPFNCF
jgi:hypothetical protein